MFKAIFSYIAFFAFVTPVLASDADMAATPIVDRQFASYEPRGISVGRMMVTPDVEIEEIYNDNIFLEDSSTNADFVTSVEPSVRGVIDLKPHEIVLEAETEIRIHAQENSEDQENYNVSADVDLSLGNNLNLVTRAAFVQEHEARSQGLTLSSPESPIEIATRSLRTRLIYAPAKLQMAFYAGIAAKAYEDNQERGTGMDLIQRDRDYTAWHAGVRADYDVGPSITPYVDVSRRWVNHDRRNYVGGNAFDGLDRDRIEDRYRVGAQFDWSKRLLGDVAFGLGVNDPEDPSDDRRQTWIADASVTWLMSAITNIGVRLNRFLDSDNDFTQGIVSTTAGFRLDHELARGVVASFDIEKQWRSFQSSPREDETVTGTLSLDYAIDRYWALAADLQYATRAAAGGGLDYEQTIAALRLKGRI